ncbi:uncharacterized protein [Aegilops tauschii subsp. strangulata]|uniref:uncharacterized protein n=1 Tax=Aegilops tauschii subsp. strangulata TaxID=200361 RepID=UPI001E1CA576|nr:uncharacterized protein LOC109731936 [Aegilops tauschii subsp. strangulata]
MSDVPASPPGGGGSGDGGDFGSVREQDRFLPIANIGSIMKKAILANGKIAKDAKETLRECVSEFIASSPARRETSARGRSARPSTSTTCSGRWPRSALRSTLSPSICRSTERLLTLVWPRSSTKTTQPCVYAGDGDFREEEGCSQEDGRKKQADSIRSSRCWPFMFLCEHQDKEVGRSIVLAHWS